MTSTRLAGHTLPDEGRVYQGGYRIYEAPAVCSCGAKSDTLTTDSARRRWHREHKTAITEEG